MFPHLPSQNHRSSASIEPLHQGVTASGLVTMGIVLLAGKNQIESTLEMLDTLVRQRMFN